MLFPAFVGERNDVEGWLNANFEGERHQRRVDMITRLEQRSSVEPTTHPEAAPAPITEEDTHPIQTYP